MVDDGLAVAWTPYRFYAGDQFSHCGTNAFTLALDGQGWRIVQIVDTRRPRLRRRVNRRAARRDSTGRSRPARHGPPRHLRHAAGRPRPPPAQLLRRPRRAADRGPGGGPRRDARVPRPRGRRSSRSATGRRPTPRSTSALSVAAPVAPRPRRRLARAVPPGRRVDAVPPGRRSTSSRTAAPRATSTRAPGAPTRSTRRRSWSRATRRRVCGRGQQRRRRLHLHPTAVRVAGRPGRYLPALHEQQHDLRDPVPGTSRTCDMPLVCDASSDFLSRPIDASSGTG